MADDKPKARPRRTAYVPTIHKEEKEVPNPLPSASKPTVNHAPKRKPYPSEKEPKKPGKKLPKEPLKEGIKKGIDAAKKQAETILFQQESDGIRNLKNKARKNGISFQKKSKRNPTNADIDIDGEGTPLTADEILKKLVGSLALQLPEVNAKLRGRKPKINQLTPKTLATICLMIRAGAYHQDAARAAGVYETTWTRWLTKGREDYENNRNTAYCQLFQLIDKSVGEAIAAKSIEAVTADPKFYLTHGPGKTRPGREGWSPSIKIEGGNDPIRVEHDHSGKIEIEGSPHLTIDLQQNQGVNDVAEAFANLQELGIVIPQKLIESMKKPIPVEANK